MLLSVQKLVTMGRGLLQANSMVEIDWLFVLGSGDPVTEVWEPSCVWKGPGPPSSRPGAHPGLVGDFDVIMTSSGAGLVELFVLCLLVVMVLCSFA